MRVQFYSVGDGALLRMFDKYITKENYLLIRIITG